MTLLTSIINRIWCTFGVHKMVESRSFIQPYSFNDKSAPTSKVVATGIECRHCKERGIKWTYPHRADDCNMKVHQHMLDWQNRNYESAIFKQIEEILYANRYLEDKHMPKIIVPPFPKSKPTKGAKKKSGNVLKVDFTKKS